jgi:putative SOS response-associated peptidase YedK
MLSGYKIGHCSRLLAFGRPGRIRRQGEAKETYTVITTDPNELMQSLHNRMPVILKPADYERWLDPGEPAQLPVELLRPFPAEEMRAC